MKTTAILVSEQQAALLVTASYPGHYVSTACQRGKHEHCGLQDKWGGEKCQCNCGHVAVTAQLTYEQQAAQIAKLEERIE